MAQPQYPLLPLLLEARRVLLWGQRELADLFGVSRRTIQRWDANETTPTPKQLCDLARVVYPRNAKVASRLAEAAGTSLEQLGLAAASPPIAAAPEPPFAASNAQMVDSITCAAADAVNLVPEAVRPALRAAFERARDLRLSPAEVASALSPAKPRATAARDKGPTK